MRRNSVAGGLGRRVVATACVVACVVGSAEGDSFEGSTSDVWDVAQGVVVTAHSPLAGGFAVEDMFGTANSTVEARETIFADGMPAGTVHFVEWRTPADVEVDGFTLRANDDFDPSKARGFSTFRLFARIGDSEDFTELYAYDVRRNPYGEHIVVTDAIPPVTAREFRAEFVQAGGPVNGGPRVREIDGPEPLVELDGGVLLLALKAKANAARPERSRIKAKGVLDTGSAPLAFGSPVTFSFTDGDESSVSVLSATPRANGASQIVEADGFALRVTPSPIGSSRAKLKVQYTGDLDAVGQRDAEVHVRYADDSAVATGRVRLEGTTYALRGKGSLRAPSFQVAKAKAKLAGGGKDRLALVLGMSRIENVPTDNFAVRLRFGDGFDVLLPADAFVRQGERYRLVHPTGGIRGAVLDFRSGLMKFVGRDMDLGTFGAGSQVVRIELALGADRRAVVVRLGRAGETLRY